MHFTTALFRNNIRFIFQFYIRIKFIFYCFYINSEKLHANQSIKKYIENDEISKLNQVSLNFLYKPSLIKMIVHNVHAIRSHLIFNLIYNISSSWYISFSRYLFFHPKMKHVLFCLKYTPLYRWDNII